MGTALYSPSDPSTCLAHLILFKILGGRSTHTHTPETSVSFSLKLGSAT